mgnify:CR=1 FL=1
MKAYKELIRNASRDENTLIQLENELRLVQLEKSKKEDPWELITKPTLLTDPLILSSSIPLIMDPAAPAAAATTAIVRIA